jgi:hypothetical protein
VLRVRKGIDFQLLQHLTLRLNKTLVSKAIR